MIDHHTQARTEWIAEISDPYYEKRAEAIQFLRSCNRYVLDKYSRVYRPSNGHTPQTMMQLRTRL